MEAVHNEKASSQSWARRLAAQGEGSAARLQLGVDGEAKGAKESEFAGAQQLQQGH